MDLMQGEQRKNTYVRYADIIQSVLFEKANDHEKRVTTLESEIVSLREELIHLNYRRTNDNQFWANKQNERTGDPVNRRLENKFTGSRMETIVSGLKDIENKKQQVQIVGELVDEIRGMLKDVPKQKNNYRRQMLLMFHETLKQNYTKNLFSETQVTALGEVARVCHKAFVSKEQYFEMDDVLCDCGLDMMPDWE